MIYLIVCVFVLLVFGLVAHKYAIFDYTTYSTYGNEAQILGKTRILCLVGIISDVGIDYFHHYASLRYIVNWQVNVSVAILLFIVLIYTYSQKVNTKRLNVGIKYTYLIMCLLYISRAYDNKLDPIICIEISILFLYSIFVFSEIKSVAIFSAIVLLSVSVATYFSDANIEHKVLFMSAAIQALIMLYLFTLIENKNLSKMLFSDTILNHSKQFVLVINNKAEVIYVNAYTVQTAGYTEKDFLGNGWYAIQNKSAEDIATYQKNIISQIKNNATDKYESTLLDESKHKTIHISWQANAIENKYILCIGQDITTEVLQKQELEKLSLVAKHVNNGVVITDKNRNIEWVNDSFLTLMGYTLPELIGKRPIHIFSGKDTDPNLKKLIVTGEFSTKDMEILSYKKDGAAVWLWVTTTILYDADKNIFKYVEILTDITARKTLESKYKYILQNAGDIIYTSNFMGHFEFINNTVKQILDYEPAELIGKHFTSIVHPSQKEMVAKFYENAVRNKTDNTYLEFLVVTKQNTPVWLSQNVNFVLDEVKKIIGFQAIVRDITDKKQTELELKNSREKLNEYAEYLEFQNTIKDKLIQSQSLNEITCNTLNYLANKLQNTSHLALFVLDEKKQNFVGKKINNHALEIEIQNVANLTYYAMLCEGNYFIEPHLTQRNNTTEYEKKLIEAGSKSYIALPIISANTLTGQLLIAFNQVNCLSEKQIKNLSELAALLSISIEQFVLKDKVIQQNKDLNDSLKYAQNIQASILPFSIQQTIIHDVAVVYKPKDHVSGDFYWIEQVADNLIIAVGDCTGHGVPGAFLTLLANSLLQKNVIENKVLSPGKILANIDEEIYTILNRNADRLVRDGMELSICVINNNTKQLTFAGAGLGLLYFIDEVPIILRGIPAPIGDYKKEAASFTETQLQLNGNETFFMNSDGFQDQLGGDNYKRLSKKVFYQYLADIKDADAETQKTYLNTKLKEHQRHYGQTDDITVLGFKIKK